jgi:hypothetical protein
MKNASSFLQIDDQSGSEKHFLSISSKESEIKCLDFIKTLRQVERHSASNVMNVYSQHIHYIALVKTCHFYNNACNCFCNSAR